MPDPDAISDIVAERKRLGLPAIIPKDGDIPFMEPFDQRGDRWVMFACAGLAHGTPAHAAAEADELLALYDERFPVPEQAGDA